MAKKTKKREKRERVTAKQTTTEEVPAAETTTAVPRSDKHGVQLPVNKLSYSGLVQLLRNPLIFKLKYILNVYDGKISVSGMVGRAGHETLKVYYGAHPDISVPKDNNQARAIALEYGLKYLEQTHDTYIEYGKTGSREQMLKTYMQAMNFYFAEEPEYHEILMAEQKLDAELTTIDGDKLPLPAVGVPDIVHKRKDGGIEIIDIKFVKSFTDYDTEDYIKIIQSQFLWHLLKSSQDLVADRMLFREVKVSENTRENAGKPQIRDYAIPFSHEQYRVLFYNLYKDVVTFLKNPDAIFLPNLADNFDGEQAGFLYTQTLLNADMSDVEVMHKVRDLAFVSKKFVSSRLDQAENKYLNPEEKIRLRLAEFGIPVEPIEPVVGTSVTLYRFKVSSGVRMTMFEKHKADIARAIEAQGNIRVLAPIPGTAYVGIEVANVDRTIIHLRDADLVPNTLTLPIGVDVHGNAVKVALNEMPHLLIAGSTGSGKSILIHSILTALTKQMDPEALHLVLIDPKRVELASFAAAPHLHGAKIIYEYQQAMEILRGLADTMESRYKLLEEWKVRDITALNKKWETTQLKAMPYIVVVIDEFADLMAKSKQQERKNKSSKSLKNVAKRVQVEQKARDFAKMGMTYVPRADEEDDSSAEDIVARLAAMARAVGIHLIIATQRPSVDVITGLIKANFPTRIALTTASATDSKVILGEEGAEKLAGKGDMLFMHPGSQGKQRLQGFLTE